MLNENFIRKGETIAVALSGGKDSIALVSILFDNADKLGITVKAINVEHGIRGETSLRDSLFVADFCKNRGIPLKSFSIDCKKFAADHGYGVEEGARIARYKFFLQAIEEGFCDKVATAHHLSDSVETLLFNLFRGASVAGVTGIGNSRNEGLIIRPFADTPKSEIEEYIEKNDLPYVDDETNFESEYSRNYIRNELMPVILARFPGAERAIGRFLHISDAENEFMDSLAEKILKSDGTVYRVGIDTPDCLCARAIVMAMKKSGIGKDYAKAHIDAVLSLKTLENGSVVSLPCEVRAAREYNDIVIYKRHTVKKFEIPFEKGDICKVVGNLSFSAPENKNIAFDNKRNSDVLYFDYGKLPGNAVIRYRRNGDEFRKFGGCKKKLNDYFTDKKIPVRLRDEIPLVCSGNEVYIICGIEISDLIKVDKDTVNVLQCKYVR